MAARFVKLQRGKPESTVTLLDRGAEKLTDTPSGRYGVDLPNLLAAVSIWRETASRMATAGSTDYDPAALPRIPLRERPSK